MNQYFEAQVNAGSSFAFRTITLTQQMVADHLHVSTRTLERLVEAGEFPRPFKAGNQNRWDFRIVANWSAQQSDNVNPGSLMSAQPAYVQLDATVPDTQDVDSAGGGPVPRRKHDRRQSLTSAHSSPRSFHPVEVTRPKGDGVESLQGCVS